MLSMSRDQVRRKRALYLCISTFVLLFLGLIYAFSMFVRPMCETFMLQKTDVSLTFNIMMIFFCIGGVASSQIEKTLDVGGTVLLSGVLFAVGFICTALFSKGNLLLVYLLYGCVCGFGVGVGYNVIIATTNVWFPEKVGFSSGVLMMGFGLGSLLLGTLSVNLIGIFGLKTIFFCVGIAVLLVTFAASRILHRPPSDIVLIMAPDQVDDNVESPANNGSILSSPIFYVYAVWSIIVIGIGLATIGNCASDAELAGIGTGFATLLVGLVSMFNGLARVLIGIIYDRTNVKITMAVNAVVAVAATLCVSLALTSIVPAAYIIGALLCGFCYGGVPVIASAFTRQCFGTKRYPFNLSIANLCIVFGSLLNVAVQVAVGGSANRLGVFMVMAVLAVVALIDVIPFSRIFNRNVSRLEELRN